MIVVDVNVLVAAHLTQHVHHDRAFRFLSRALVEESVLVPDLVWSGFLRIVTNGRIFEVPASITEAVTFVRAVCAAGGYRPVSGLTDGLDPFLGLLIASESSANLVPDAYIAAVAMAHGCPVATFDRDFRRFDSVEIVTPE